MPSVRFFWPAAFPLRRLRQRQVEQGRARGAIGWLCSGYGLALAFYLGLRVLFGDGLWWLALLNMAAPFLFLPLLLLLPLALLVRRPYPLALLLLLTGIGLLWMGGYWFPQAASGPPTGPTLRIATLNVWRDNRPPEASRLWQWLREEAFDIVLLQELRPSWHLDADTHTRLDLADLYPYQALETANWSGEAILTLSRYPIRSANGIDTIDVASDEPRLQHVVLDVAGQPVSLYNVHLNLPLAATPAQAGASTESLFERLGHYDVSTRDEQIEGLLALIAADTMPVIIAGDFNLSEHSLIYGDLAAQLTDAFRVAGRGLGASWPVAETLGLPGWLPPLLRIDYIWHSHHFRTREAGQGPPLGSDHLPQYAVLDLQIVSGVTAGSGF